MKNVSQSQLHDLIFTLQGTCLDFATACVDCGFDEDDLTIEQLQELDSWIFCCPGCGWWCERGEAREVDGIDYCEDCSESMGYYDGESDENLEGSDHFILV